MPKNISSFGKSKPWITSVIPAAIRWKRRLEKKPVRIRNHNLLDNSFGNSKKVWSHINTILGKNRKLSSTSIKLYGIIINEPELIASSFNTYFNRIPTSLSNNMNNNILTLKIILLIKFQRQKISNHHQFRRIPRISVKLLTVWIIIFYYLNSNDRASMKLHYNGSI